MSSVTSMVYVGYGHPNDGGIHPIATIQLEEGSRPNFSILFGGRALYIPTIENMLDDLIFMIAVEVIKSPLAIQLFNQHYIVGVNKEKKSASQNRRIQMYDDFNEASRLIIYSALKATVKLPKVIICLFKGSELCNSAINIQNYNLEFEICESIMGNQYSHWSKGLKI